MMSILVSQMLRKDQLQLKKFFFPEQLSMSQSCKIKSNDREQSKLFKVMYTVALCPMYSLIIVDYAYPFLRRQPYPIDNLMYCSLKQDVAFLFDKHSGMFLLELFRILRYFARSVHNNKFITIGIADMQLASLSKSPWTIGKHYLFCNFTAIGFNYHQPTHSAS